MADRHARARWYAIGLGMLVGCSTTSNETTRTCAPASTTTPSCVEYDGPLQTGSLPYEADAASTQCGPCAPRCNAPVIDGFATAAALPSGSCTGEESCDLGARLVCACPAARGPVNGYRCSCESGKWRCRTISQGGSPCMNSVCDAGGDG